MPYFPSSFGKVYFEYYPKAESPCLVFLNGLTQSTANWLGLKPLLEPNYSILLLDLIFQGLSEENERYLSFEEHAQVIWELLENLQLQSVGLVGISYGGAVAMRFAVNYPQMLSHLVLISTFAHKTKHFDAMGASWAKALEIGGYEHFSDILLPWALGKSYYTNPLIPIDTLVLLRKQFPLAPQRILQLMQATYHSGDYRPQLKNIQTPTLVIQGSEDIVTPPEMGQAIVKAIPQAAWVLLEGYGHTLNLEAVPLLAQHIQRFVS